MSETHILLEEWSPICAVQAFVEESDTCCYFYLWFHPGKEDGIIKSCWICNTAGAPEQIDVDGMQSGMAPAMPKEFVGHDIDGIRLHKEKLSIVWFEEGDAAALLEGDKLLCVIPGWSDGHNFNGYSRYAVGTTPYAWELTQAEAVLRKRVEKSRDFWNYFEGEYWEEVQNLHVQTLETFYGKYEKYYAIDGGKFPPKALITGQKEGVYYGITAGVSLFPMPKAEQYFGEETPDYRRIELGFAATEEQQEVCMKMYSLLSGISSLPWDEVSFLGHGHTVPCGAIEGFAAVWLLDARLLPQIDAPSYPDFMGEKINLLWSVPLTQQEYEIIREIGTEQMLQRLEGRLDKIHIFDGRGLGTSR